MLVCPQKQSSHANCLLSCWCCLSPSIGTGLSMIIQAAIAGFRQQRSPADPDGAIQPLVRLHKIAGTLKRIRLHCRRPRPSPPGLFLCCSYYISLSTQRAEPTDGGVISNSAISLPILPTPCLRQRPTPCSRATMGRVCAQLCHFRPSGRAAPRGNCRRRAPFWQSSSGVICRPGVFCRHGRSPLLDRRPGPAPAGRAGVPQPAPGPHRGAHHVARRSSRLRGPRAGVEGPRLRRRSGDAPGAEVQDPKGPHGAAAPRAGAALHQLAGEPVAPG